MHTFLFKKTLFWSIDNFTMYDFYIFYLLYTCLITFLGLNWYYWKRCLKKKIYIKTQNSWIYFNWPDWHLVRESICYVIYCNVLWIVILRKNAQFYSHFQNAHVCNHTRPVSGLLTSHRYAGIFYANPARPHYRLLRETSLLPRVRLSEIQIARIKWCKNMF